MKKKQIKQLAQESYVKGQLDKETVEYIASKLSRHDLKQYINQLQSIQQKNTVVITAAVEPTEKDKKSFEEMYPGKTIEYQIDSTLLMGVEIRDNDIVYNRSLKNRLENLATHVGQL